MTDAEKVQRVLEALTPRELGLATDVACAGHAEGCKWWAGGGQSLTYPEMVADVIGRCLSQPGWYPTVYALAEGAVSDEPVVEHAILMSGGSMQVRSDDPEIERIYPLAEWIGHQQRHGGKVYRRTVIVVEDWEEVPR